MRVLVREPIAEALAAIEDELVAAGASIETGRAAPAALEAYGSAATA